MAASIDTLSSALLTRILTLLAPKKHAPHKRLVPLLRVNKHWHALVLPLLYTAISVKGVWVARPLRKTLEANTELARRVEELVLDTELSAQDLQETLDHLRIVAAAAPSLRRLTVLGYAAGTPQDMERYRKALAACAVLETLNMSEGRQGMFTFAQLLGMLAGWPRLEKLILKNTLLPSGSDSPATQQQGCARLKMVKITDSFEPANQFSFAAFAAAAPSVSVLWLQAQRAHPIPADLFDALRVWAPTLQALCLLSDSDSEAHRLPLPPFPFPALSSLTRLDTSSHLLPPRQLIAAAPLLPALTALAYTIYVPAQLIELVEALGSSRGGGAPLRALRTLEVKAAAGGAGAGVGGVDKGGKDKDKLAAAPMRFSPAAVHAVRTMCKKRRIRFTMV